MTNLETVLNRISENERKILQCLSLFWEPITAIDFQKFLRSLGFRTSDGKLYNPQYISLLRNSLIHKGLLINLKETWGTGFQLADESIKTFLTREAIKEDWFQTAVETIKAEFGFDEYKSWYWDKDKRNFRLLREYRLSIYQKQVENAQKLYAEIGENNLAEKARVILLDIFAYPFQKEFLGEFDKIFRSNIIPPLLENSLLKGESTAELWEFVNEDGLQDSPVIKSIKAEELIIKGEIAAAKKIIGEPANYGNMLLTGTIACLEKDYKKAVLFFEECNKLWRKIYAKKKGFSADWQLFFYGLALYKTDEEKFHKFADDYLNYAIKNYPDEASPRAVKAISYFLKNSDNLAGISFAHIKPDNIFAEFICIVTASIVPSFKVSPDVSAFALNCRRAGYIWFEYETANLLKIKGKPYSVEDFERWQNQLGFEPLGNIIPRLEDWERALNTLEIIARQSAGKTDSKTKIDETRVAWLLNFENKEIQPVEQKFGKKGWTDGRNIALKRMSERDVKNLTEQDGLVVKNSLHRDSGYYYGGYEYEFIWHRAIEALVEHPFLFSANNPSVGIQLNHAEPNLIVKEIGKELELSFDVKITDEGIIVKKETETRYKVIKVTKQHVDIYDSLKSGKLRVPVAGREKLLKIIQPLTGKISVQSDLEEHFENLPTVEAEKRIHALITPANEGFHLEFFVKPFGTIPPYFKPGKGIESVVGNLEGIRTRTKRDLKNERKLLKEIEESCPFLAEFESPNYDWALSDAEACLTAMSELETPRNAGNLVVEWTKGQKLKLLGNVNFDNFSMSVKSSGTWFEVDGKVKVNEDLVLSMKELTKLLTTADTNFIELSDGQFIAITEKLRKHLQSLNAATDDKNRLFNLGSGILEEFADELENFKADKAWKEHLVKIRAAQKFVPELPKTFDADLRPYQITGYEWLSRLANWGVGACLADDMGLGKTLQALALLVERAEKGVALVVAPVSVCRNWIKEAHRFSPTLKFHLFGEGDRKTQVESLGNYDVLVTSYSLLQLEEELFTSQKFATIVLDEAQAVKNRTTKRSKTVMNLQADFRLITTGTPVENHLGELWNLFNFINPHLLGNYEFFSRNFAVPIEKNGDENARKTLQKLIKPFILRRRKNQVLDDLPPKTEIMLTVEMSAEERAFYESVRREALERIESTDGEAKDKRFRILAELTRLRLACCHPKLVNENIDSGSSKLELFGETLAELLENKHKALVFSQFVKHLRIVEEYLKNKGINYHYLDGSTPPNVRQERIDAFQRGSGDVFLISLKAGGTGLNLTAADYVIHLDPWWNPAVEDQATDRVHRIGQQRPVTVYRLVTADTVEEKILKLHETKRDLADSLLDGTEASGKLSAEDLLALIGEGF